jgi:hypothetical protein
MGGVNYPTEMQAGHVAAGNFAYVVHLQMAFKPEVQIVESLTVIIATY